VRQDLRFTFRQFRKTPGFTAIAVVSLALGIGANTAVFSLVNGILLRALPVPSPHELRVLRWSGTGQRFAPYSGSIEKSGPGIVADAFSFPVFAALRARCADQADIFGYFDLPNTTVRVQREASTGDGLLVSGNFFSALGVNPALGRMLGPDNEKPGAAPVVVISYRLWEREFALAPSALGATVTLNGNPLTVIGVLPREFRGVQPGTSIDFYLPLSVQPRFAGCFSLTAPNQSWFKLMARLRAGVSANQFHAAVDVVFPSAVAGQIETPSLIVSDGHAGPQWQQRHYRRTLLLLSGIVGLVVLVVCANLAGLVLARGAARQHEFAVRASLGSTRWRLAQHALTECIVLAFIGAGLGWFVAWWTQSALGQLLAGTADGLEYDISLDLRVFAFTVAIAIATALLAGLLPALHAARVDPIAGLKTAATVLPPRIRFGRLLIAAQIALSVVLVAGGTLYVRTLGNRLGIDPGFATEDLLLFRLNPRVAGHRDGQLVTFYDQVQSALTRIPGVRSAALTEHAFLGRSSSSTAVTLTGHPKPFLYLDKLNVGETFFATMGIPLKLGRGFTANDTAGAPKVVVVNDAFARDFLPGENPVGRTMSADGTRWEIVGVCADASYTELRPGASPIAYFPFRQSATGAAFFAVRTALPPLSVVSAARQAVAAIDPNVPLADITTQTALRDEQIASERMFAVLCGSLAGLALLLSGIGLFGLMGYSVARRTGDIGVRLALGATRREIAQGVLREAFLLTAIGLVAGLPSAVALAQLIKSQLYGVQPSDPLALVAGSFLLLAVTLLAAWLPARRATRVDPMIALRAE
jgi:predicted permease